MKYSRFAFVVIFYCFCILRRCAAICQYPEFKNNTSPPGHSRLSHLIGQRLQAENEDYIFSFGICTSAIQSPHYKYAGVIQTEKKGDKRLFVVGRTNESYIVSGSVWLLLEYRRGDNYSSKCGHENRRAMIMFVCDKNKNGVAEVQILDENTEKSAGCYYLFEIGHASICPQPKPLTVLSKLSVGSIIILTFFIIVALYLVIGFFIQRSRGSKGFDQIPNYAMWQEFGNLIADGCDFVFRSRPKATNHLYPPMDDRRARQTLEPDDTRLVDEDGDDDHLLPM